MPLGTCDAGFFRGGRIHVRRCRRDCAVRAPHKAFRDAMAVVQSVVCPALLRRWAPTALPAFVPCAFALCVSPKSTHWTRSAVSNTGPVHVPNSHEQSTIHLPPQAVCHRSSSFSQTGQTPKINKLQYVLISAKPCNTPNPAPNHTCPATTLPIKPLPVPSSKPRQKQPREINPSQNKLSRSLLRSLTIVVPAFPSAVIDNTRSKEEMEVKKIAFAVLIAAASAATAVLASEAEAPAAGGGAAAAAGPAAAATSGASALASAPLALFSSFLAYYLH
jgi:hypothetical protein